jgi:hypothetical protein
MEKKSRINKSGKNSLVLVSHQLELQMLVYSLLKSGKELAYHVVGVGHSLPSRGVAARTCHCRGVEDIRVTSLVEVGRESIDRREGGR